MGLGFETSFLRHGGALDRRRTYLDPEGGFLRAGPGGRTQDKIRAMAGIMARHATGDGACTDEHLRAAGFSLSEIAAWRDSAVVMARASMGAAG